MAILKIDMTWFFSVEGGPIWIKFRRLVQNDMSTAVIWPKLKPEVEFQYGGRLDKFNGMLSQSHLPHCRMLPPGEFNVMIPELHHIAGCCHRANSLSWFQSYVPHCRVLLPSEWHVIAEPRFMSQGVRIKSAIFKIVFRHILLLFP